MKSTGIVRKIDELGRVVIPKETRNLLLINEGDPLEIFRGENTIILKKYAPGCTLCGNLSNITMFKGQPICQDCKEHLRSQAAQQ